MKKTLAVLAITAMAGLASAQTTNDLSAVFANADFDNPAGAIGDWGVSSGGGITISYPTNGGVADTGYGRMDATGGGWGVWVAADVPLPLAPLGLVPGTQIEVLMDMKTFTSNGGILGGMKVESWGQTLLGDSGDMEASGESAEWATYSWPYTIEAGATGIKFVPLWNAGDDCGYDNLRIVVPDLSLVTSISSPAEGSTNSDVAFTITASAAVSPGSVTNVSFFDGPNPLGSDDSYPYSFVYSNATPGSHQLTVVAQDSSGNSATSSVVTIQVESIAPPPLNYPTNNAPAPVYASSVSLYNSSSILPNDPDVNWFAPWNLPVGVSGQGNYTITNTGAVVKKYLTLNYAGVELNPTYVSNGWVDVTGETTLHVDVWTTANQISVQLQSTAGQYGNAGAIVDFPATNGVVTSNQWVSLDIPLSAFTNINPNLDLTRVDQILWLDNAGYPGVGDGSGVLNGDFYIDNVYFHSGVTNVILPYPTNNAPTPTRPAANVVSLFNSSGTYTDKPGINWYAGFGSGTIMADYLITNTSTTVKSYKNLSYVGVELDPSYTAGQETDISAATTMHVDVWTTANQFGIKLVTQELGVGPSSEAEYQMDVTTGLITPYNWVSLDIPLSTWTDLNGSLDMSRLIQILWTDNFGVGVQNGSFFIDNVYFYNTRPVIQSPAVSGGNFTMQVGSETGTDYVLESTPSLTPPAWTAIQTNAGTGGMLNFSAPVGTGNELFRIKTQ